MEVFDNKKLPIRPTKGKHLEIGRTLLNVS
jgi:hypothetical protein